MQKSRVDKFRKHRDEIEKSESLLPEEGDFIDNAMIQAYDESQLQQETIKKSTLSLSIDEIMKQHDEYTIIMEQDQLNEKLAFERKQQKEIQRKKRMERGIIALLIVIGVVLVVVTVLLIMGSM